MPHFNVTVEIAGHMTYVVEADDVQTAKSLALDMVDGDTRIGHLDVVNKGVVDCADESAEYE